MKSPRPWITVLSLVLAVAACQPRPVPAPEPEPAPKRATWPAFDYQVAAQKGASVFRLDPTASRLDIVVRRAGPLSRLGHDHVIESRSLEAWIYWPEDLVKARADLRLHVKDLEVDPGEARHRFGMETVPDAEAIEGTRRNMLEKVLMAERWPHVTVRLEKLSGGPGNWEVEAAFTVRDHLLQRRVPVSIDRADDSLEIRGSLAVTHADLGLEPYAALAGAIRVADDIELHFKLLATRYSR